MSRSRFSVVYGYVLWGETAQEGGTGERRRSNEGGTHETQLSYSETVRDGSLGHSNEYANKVF